MARMTDRGYTTCGHPDCKPCTDDGYESKEMAVVAEYLYWRLREKKLARKSLDLGAHVGLWSAFLAVEYVRYGGGCIYAFEPDPENFRALTKNTQEFARAGATGIRPVQAAAWNSNRTLLLKPGYSPASRYVAESGPYGPDSGFPCKGITIDSVPACGTVTLDFVKVDVEGAELPVMNGMRQTLEDNPTLLVLIEYCAAHFARYGYGTEKMTAFMNASGMRFARPDDEEAADLVQTDGLKKIFFTKGDSPWQ